MIRFTSLVCRSDIVFVLFEVQVREKAYELKSKCLNLPKPQAPLVAVSPANRKQRELILFKETLKTRCQTATVSIPIDLPFSCRLPS